MAPRWGKKFNDYLYEQFKKQTLKPYEEGQTEYILLELSKGDHSLLHPFLAKPKGEQSDNNKIFGHYRKAACEYIVQNALKGFRRGQSRAVLSLLFALLLLPLTLLFSSLDLLPSAQYLQEKALSGKRQREDSCEDSDEDGFDESVSLGSEDTEEEDMAPKGKAPSTPGSTKKAPGAPKRDDVDELTDRLKEIKIQFEAGQRRGQNMTCILPHIWTVYTIDGHNYLRISFLTWGILIRDFLPLISKDGLSLNMTVKFPPIFTDQTALYKYQYAGALEQGGGTDSMYETVNSHIKCIKEKTSMERIEAKLKIGLPFKCSQTFEDPYDRQDGPGYEHMDYPYKAKADQVTDAGGNLVDAPETRTNEEMNTRVSMLVLTLKAADEHREEFVPSGRRFT
jgi:hypothetical protein